MSSMVECYFEHEIFLLSHAGASAFGPWMASSIAGVFDPALHQFIFSIMTSLSVVTLMELV